MSRILKLRGEDGRWLEVPAIKGSTGATFTPSISSDGILSWSNNKGLTNPPPVSIKGPVGDDGRDGSTYTPHMSETGDLTWTNNNGLPNPDPINLRGPNGIWIEPTEPPDGYDVWIIIDAESSGSGSTEEVLAELLDARVGYDGTTYNSVGSAIRTQINEIYRVLGEYSVSVDATLTSEGIPADAKATGDSIRETGRLASEALNGLRDETNRALDSLDKSKQPKGEYLTEESDPTVPEWAKSETKPTYTAQEVGARPDTWTPTARDVGAVTQSNEGSEATIRLPQTPMLTGMNEPFYPLTHASQVVRTDGSRLEQNGMINVDTAITANKLGGKAPEYYIQPRNLLDNSYFINPIAQAGIGGKHGNQAYAIDRWILDSGTVSLEAGVGLTLNGVMRQKLEYPPAGPVSAFVGISSGEATIAYAGGEVTITSAGGVLLWSALYEGVYTADTRPIYVYKGYASELLECQRYYYKIPHSSTMSYPGYFYNFWRFTIQTPVPMRVSPTLIVGDLTNFGIWSEKDMTGTINDVTVCEKNSNAVSLKVTGTFTPRSISGVLRFNTSAALSADL